MRKEILDLFPDIRYEELDMIEYETKELDADQLRRFASYYRSRRKDPQTILLLTIVGFFGVAGLQRFVTDRIGLGILHLLTGGFCLIGTIVDLLNYKDISMDYNHRAMMESMYYAKG